jgi:hypothetical protein
MARLSAFWAEFQLVIYLVVALALSAWLNLHQHGKLAAAKAECHTQMVTAALTAIELERNRAAAADKQAGQIADRTHTQTQTGVRAAQGSTNEREAAIRTVVVHGDCRMPVGLPRLDPAVAAANAAAGD